MVNFNDSTIEEIFGADDAENERPERLLQYFYTNQAYASLTSDLPVRVLVAHKGVGKSALLKRAYLEDEKRQRPALWLKPNDLVDARTAAAAQTDFILRIEEWKKGILRETLSYLIRQKYGENAMSVVSADALNKPRALAQLISKSLKDDYGGLPINIFIDDIDRGWSAEPNDVRNISALLNAIRDIGGDNPNIRIRIGLRSDVYFLVRTSDESTDKIERHVIWLRWTNDEILRVMALRVSTYFKLGYDQQQIAPMRQKQISDNILSNVIAPRYNGRGRWADIPTHIILMSLTRSRPRDLVKLFHAAAKRAQADQSPIIETRHLEGALESYSQERLQDIVNEFRSELPQIEKLLFELKPTTRERRTAENYQFTTDKLINKLKSAMEHVPMNFTNGRLVSPSSLIQFLYKIDFITARRDNGNLIDRKYFDESRFLAADIADFGYGWEIHPAYRWALQPQDIASVFDSLDAAENA